MITGSPQAAFAPSAGELVSATVKLARSFGVRCDNPTVLRDRANLIVHLAPAPVVARIPFQLNRFRDDVLGGQRIEVTVTGHLAAHGLPVIAPLRDIAPGPHTVLDRHVTFWPYVAKLDERPEPSAVRDSLTAIHRALSTLSIDLTGRGPARDIIGALVRIPLSAPRQAAIRAELDSLLEVLASAPTQPLHGDPHTGNVYLTAMGLRWTDFEDIWCGPVEWDEACLMTGRTPLRPTPRHDGDPEVLSACLSLRRLQADMWSACTG